MVRGGSPGTTGRVAAGSWKTSTGVTGRVPETGSAPDQHHLRESEGVGVSDGEQ